MDISTDHIRRPRKRGGLSNKLKMAKRAADSLASPDPHAAVLVPSLSTEAMKRDAILFGNKIKRWRESRMKKVDGNRVGEIWAYFCFGI